jgi:hypothetical protein
VRTRLVLLSSLLALLAVVALVRAGGSEPDFFSPAALEALLDRPLDPLPGRDGDARPAWRAVLEELAEPAPGGLTLRLGRVLADPTAARASADSAGELLSLEAEGAQGKLGLPLWRAILAGPALEPGPERKLKLNGCRSLALPEYGPAIDDSYWARLSLARALRELAATEPDGAPLTLLGEDAPVRGGVNFDVQLLQGSQTVCVTFDGQALAPLRAARPFAPLAPNDARARASLVQVLCARAQQAGLGTLSIVDPEPGSSGVDVRIEVLGGRQSMVARRGDTRLAAHRVLADEDTHAQ